MPIPESIPYHKKLQINAEWNYLDETVRFGGLA
jgi:hypothetical protein